MTQTNIDRFYRSSESVCEGHPDKLADQISDAILDEHLTQDPSSRVAVETLVTRNLIVLAGEVRSSAYVDFETVARKVAEEVGYVSDEVGLDARRCEVHVRIQRQSEEIAVGVDRGGAGDQGIMFGYAAAETKELMPAPLAVAHALTRRATEVRRQVPELGLRPDGKSQVTIEYEGIRPIRVRTVVVSLQHDPKAVGTIRDIAADQIVAPVLASFSNLDHEQFQLIVNPTGSFVHGGPACDTGVTGRKIIVDTYGGAAPHGGGAFSGKDGTKVDRSAAYMARLAAKSLVSQKLVEQALVCVGYAIGLEEPLMLDLQADAAPSDVLEARRRLREFDFRPAAIIERLSLRSPVFRQTATNGHFGHPEFRWESTGE